MKRIISVIFISLFTFSLSYGRTSGYNELKNAYYGDTHVHTATSADAYVFGVFADQDQAYRFAQGKAIKHSSGKKYKRTFALDFLALSDHSEFLNLFTLTDEELKKYGLENDEYLKRLKPEALKKLSAKERDELYRELAADIIKGTVNKAFLSEKLKSEQWRKVVDRANRYYKPGKFTTFSAYEWSSTPNNNNLHRIVLFKDKAPNMIFSSLDSIKPEDLWTFLEAQRKKGIVTMAIPHNANLSNGLMFADKDSYGKKFTKAYAKRRLMNEPLQELLQLKGNSETHPAFAKNDEFANFELYNIQLGSADLLKPHKADFVREAYKKGLKYKKDLGVNPYAFGLFGGSDTHVAMPAPQEAGFGGGHGIQDESAKKRLAEDVTLGGAKMGAQSLSGVWAEENTREAIWAAMERKETFVTSGTRIKVRFFASTKYDKKQAMGSNWISYGYKNGVPMGGVIEGAKKAPSFIVWAIKDPSGANLDRIQIIKGWLDKNGKTHEKIYNVVWSDMDKRKMDKNGKIPAVGNTVNLKKATYKNSIGEKELKAFWTDPDFDPAQNAFYYPRVLEIPTPKWTLYDALELKIKNLNNKVHTLQERAWTSPIWFYTK